MGKPTEGLPYSQPPAIRPEASLMQGLAPHSLSLTEPGRYVHPTPQPLYVARASRVEVPSARLWNEPARDTRQPSAPFS